MPSYVYGCQDPEHPRRPVVHRMTEDPVILCEECGAPMHRIPQRPAAIQFSGSQEILLDWMEENYNRYRYGGGRRAKKLKTPNRIGKPIPGRLAHRR